jgi:hypothetical protein
VTNLDEERGVFVDTALLLLLLVAIIFVSSLCRCSRRREREENSGEDVVSFLSASRFCQSFFCFSFNDAWAKRFVFTTTTFLFFRGNRASTTAAILVASDDMMSLAFIAVLLYLLYRLPRARAQRVVSSQRWFFICRSNDELHRSCSGAYFFTVERNYLFFSSRKVTRHLGARGHQKKIIIIINRFIIIRSTTTE